MVRDRRKERLGEREREPGEERLEEGGREAGERGTWRQRRSTVDVDSSGTDASWFSTLLFTSPGTPSIPTSLLVFIVFSWLASSGESSPK